MKRTGILCLALAVAASLDIVSVNAQTAGQAAPTPSKVAILYFQGAIVGSKDGQKAAAELESKALPKKKELEQRQNEVNGLQDQLTKGQNTLSDAAKNELYRNIEAKKKTLNRDYDDAKEEMDQEQQKLIQQIAQKMTAVIDRYAKDHGYYLVVDVSSPQSPVLYASTSIDITKDIIELYDQSSAAMTNPAPAKPATSPGTTPKPATPVKPPGSKQ